MRGPRNAAWKSATIILLIVITVAFVMQEILFRYFRIPIVEYFALKSLQFSRGDLWQLLTGHGLSNPLIIVLLNNVHVVWQLFTFQFIHAGPLHLFLNLFVIYVFGRVIEDTLGAKAFLKLYFFSGVLGGLLQLSLMWLMPNHFMLPNSKEVPALLGASAGGFGLIAAYAALFPEQPLTILLAFVFPLSMRAKFLLLFSALFALFGIVVPYDNVAHAAHLGGLLGGLAFIRWVVRPAEGLFGQVSAESYEPPRQLVSASVSKKGGRRPANPYDSDELPSAEFISREVDPILDKISAHGIQSLTVQERRILEAARRKMGRK